MNKIVILRDYWKLVVKMLPEKKRMFAREFLLSEYGVAFRIDNNLIADDSKFALFMLKYPEHIVRIEHE